MEGNEAMDTDKTFEKKANDNKKRWRKESIAYKIGQSVNYIILTLLGFVTLYPFWYILVLSFNTGKDAVRGGIYFWPRVFTLDNYTVAFRNPLIFSSFMISVSRVIILILLTVFLTALMAYAFTQKGLPGRRWMLLFFFFPTLFGAGLIPMFLTYRQFGILNNYWVLILPSIYNFMYMIILRTYFYTIPSSLPEAARIDGANEFGIFFRIMLPLSMPTLATIALFTGVNAWNDWFTGLYFLSMRRDLWPAATLLRDLIKSVDMVNLDTGTGMDLGAQLELMGTAFTLTPKSIRMAFIIILTAPIIVIYPFLQKYFIKGVMIGSVKE